MKSGTHHSSPITRRAAAALALAGILTVLITAAGCDYLPFGYTPIKEITAAPGQFEGKEVKLKGRVKTIVKVMGVKAYSLHDETGDITVVTSELPAENAEVALKGVVKYPIRIKCAVLAWDVLQEALDSAGTASGSAPHAV
jgi:hypothetical protein